MTIVSYPAELNQKFLVSGFQTERPDRRIEAQASRGRPWIRDGNSKIGGRPLSGTIQEPIGNVAKFWRFWEDALKRGKQPFIAENPQTNGIAISNEDGLIVTDGSLIWVRSDFLLVRFMSVAQEVPVQGAVNLWQMAYQLLVIA